MTHLPSALRRICLVFPIDIPRGNAVMEWREEKFGADCALERLASHPVPHTEVMALIERLLDEVPHPAGCAFCISDQSEDAAHDEFFYVSRVRGFSADVFGRMILEARLCFLQDVYESGVMIGLSLLEEIDLALAELGVTVWGADAAMSLVSRWETRSEELTAGWAMSRWVRGHQIFAALSQGLIFSFLEMAQAIKSGNSVEVRRWAELSISLLAGSGAAFVLTGDFSVDEYMAVVRPSMMPPTSAINLSGLMSVDHRFLVQVLRDMRPALRSLHEQEPELHERLQQALSTVYDRHIHVCERFVGERPSLLTARHAKKSGPSLIEQFKHLRMKAFEAPAHTQRLNEPCPVAPIVSEEMDLVSADSGHASRPKAAKQCPKDL